VAEKSQAGSKVELFQQLSRDYYSLSNDITQELSKSPENRVEATTFMRNSDTKYRDLEKSTPPIPRSIINNFTKQNQKYYFWDKIHKPNILSTLEPTSSTIWTSFDDVRPPVNLNVDEDVLIGLQKKQRQKSENILIGLQEKLYENTNNINNNFEIVDDPDDPDDNI
jgi:hypothetical protein